jgi:myo-inositol-1(or 4)-monophosphatase
MLLSTMVCAVENIMTVAVRAAREAGELLRESQGRIRSVEEKHDRSLVTNVDRESERLIAARIREAFPGHGVAGEEHGSTGGEAEYLWVIDPLDGTHNYIRGIGLYGVSIGILRKGPAGRSFVAGVIYFPSDDSVYAAERGSGAWRNSQRLSVSRHTELSSASVAIDSVLRPDVERRLRVVGALAERAFNIRMIGSSARLLTWIAEGTLDGVIEFDDKPWDFAAGAVMVEEAGGRITTFANAPLPYAASDWVASNTLLHGELCAVACTGNSAGL